MYTIIFMILSPQYRIEKYKKMFFSSLLLKITTKKIKNSYFVFYHFDILLQLVQSHILQYSRAVIGKLKHLKDKYFINCDFGIKNSIFHSDLVNKHIISLVPNQFDEFKIKILIFSLNFIS